MDSETKSVVLAIVCASLVAISGVGGCTFLVARNNAEYYDIMQRCVVAGGTFIPTAGGHSNAACIMPSVRQ